MALLEEFDSRNRLSSRRKWRRGRLLRPAIWSGMVLFVLAALALAGFGLEKLFYSRNPHFILRKIEVEAAVGVLESDKILRELGLREMEDNLYRIELGEVRRKLLQRPMIQEAEVRRMFAPVFREIFCRAWGEGFAEYLSHKFSPFYRNGFVLPVEELIRRIALRQQPLESEFLGKEGIGASRERRILLYAQVHSMVKYLIQKYGRDKYREFYFAVPVTEERFNKI